ncbi:MAG: alpha-galactosidase [Acidobacteria bacterium]|nr:alpha-galactosidase [Acidobacteriota bacterium]
MTFLLLLLLADPAQTMVQVDGRSIRVEFDRNLHSRVVSKYSGQPVALSEWSASEFVSAGGQEIRDFPLQTNRTEDVRDSLGKGRRHVLTGTAGFLRKEVRATVYDAYPGTAIMQVRYTNTGRSPLQIDKWTGHHYMIRSPRQEAAPFWSFQAGSYENRPAWVVPLKAGFRQDNYQGMNATDYGGGTPVVDVWRRDGGIGVGHIELVPKLVSLPVSMPDESTAELAITYACNRTLEPGQSLDTFRTFVSVHKGDYFATLTEYRRLMIAQGVRFPKSPPDAFEPIWCAWGYRRNFTPDQIYGALPVVKKLGFRWVTLDDGWQTAEGDWYPVKTKFPAGDKDMRAVVDRIHADGFKAQLWWAPMSVDPDTDLIRNHPEWLLLNKDGSRQKISYWNAFYLCPAVPEVRGDAAALAAKAIKVWGFDGFKLDGQYMNAAPPCYNPAHRHKDPNESVEGVPGFFKAIFDAAVATKPDVVVEYCPCGTAFSFFALPYMNMSVASDPRRSWQVRTKGKSLKALHGDSIAYFGDHVELSDEGRDFASTVALGGVVGTEFTWPVGSGPVGRSGKRTSDLTPEREAHWSKWLGVYKEKMLSKGEYLGALYDIGFDQPETHAVRKDGKLYYGFFAAEFSGKVELRGLEPREYRVVDYENGTDLGTVKGPVAHFDVAFKHHLLLEAKP